MLEAVPDWAEDASTVRARMLRILSLVAARYRTCGEPALPRLVGPTWGKSGARSASVSLLRWDESAIWAHLLHRYPCGSYRTCDKPPSPSYLPSFIVQ